MFRLLQSSWFVTLTGGVLYLGTTAALIKPSHLEGARPARETEVKRSAEDDPSWKFRNPEFDQWINEIKREKEALGAREQQLKDLQTRLDTERSELNLVTQSIFQLQAEFDRNIVRYKASEPENVKRQIKVLGAMAPEDAVAMVSRMPDDDVVRILALMKPDDASIYLNTISKSGKDGARRASALLERMHDVLPPPAAGRGNATP